MDTLIRTWIYTGFLSVGFFILGIHALISDKPIFIGSKMMKHQINEWIYTNIGAAGTGIIFILIGALLAYWCFSDFKRGD